MPPWLGRIGVLLARDVLEAFLPGDGCRSTSSRDNSKHLPASSSFPFFTGEFNQVGIATRVLRLTVSSEFTHRPERTVLG
jgi:hypothetical protein